MMQQLNIEYFFPLTEQIPLDLDYTECISNPTLYLSEGSKFVLSGSSSLAVNQWVTVNTGRLELDVEHTIIKVAKKPPLYRRALYKLMGIDWKIK
jgi:hypothetical protein